MVCGLKEANPAFETVSVHIHELSVAVAAAGGLGEGVEAAFGAIDNGEADIDTGFDELGGDEDNGLSALAKPLCPGKHEHDMPGTHACREMNCGGALAEFFVEDLGGFGGVEDEEAAVRGMFADVVDELFVGEGAEVLAGDAFEGSKERGCVPQDGGDFLGRDTDGEVFAAFEGGLGGGAEDGGGAEIMNQTAKGT